MSTRAFYPCSAFTLAACQSQNPYTDESAPIPPALRWNRSRRPPTRPRPGLLQLPALELAQPASGYGLDQR